MGGGVKTNFTLKINGMFVWAFVPVWFHHIGAKQNFNHQIGGLYPTKSVRLAFKFCPIKTVYLDCSKFHLIKAISNAKKELLLEGHRANQMFK